VAVARVVLLAVDFQHDANVHRVAKPRQLPNTRSALTAWELEQINATARVSGNDAVLDALLLRLHTETACRRGGALAIRLKDADSERCLVSLREKAAPSAGNPSHQHSPTASSTTPPPAPPSSQPIPYCGTETDTHSPPAATTTSGDASANNSPESQPKASPPTDYDTPPSPGSNDTSATASPAPTPATPTPPDQPPPPTSKPASKKSPPRSPR
jgi:hypothetical protein